MWQRQCEFKERFTICDALFRLHKIIIYHHHISFPFPLFPPFHLPLPSSFSSFYTLSLSSLSIQFSFSSSPFCVFIPSPFPFLFFLFLSITHCIGICVHSTGLYIITEFVSGGDVRKLLKTNPTLSWKKKVRISIDLAKAMRFLHSKKIIHRDLKSKSILNKHRGGGGKFLGRSTASL